MKWPWVVALVVVAVAAIGIFSRYRAPSKVAPVSERKMLAVLPFENLGAAGRRVLRRGDHRGNHEPARDDKRARGDLPHERPSLRRHEQNGEGNRRRAGCRVCPRGNRSMGPEARRSEQGPDHAAAHPRVRRHAPLVGTLRSRDRRHLRDSIGHRAESRRAPGACASRQEVIRRSRAGRRRISRRIRPISRRGTGPVSPISPRRTGNGRYKATSARWRSIPSSPSRTQASRRAHGRLYYYLYDLSAERREKAKAAIEDGGPPGSGCSRNASRVGVFSSVGRERRREGFR